MIDDDRLRGVERVAQWRIGRLNGKVSCLTGKKRMFNDNFEIKANCLYLTQNNLVRLNGVPLLVIIGEVEELQ